MSPPSFSTIPLVLNNQEFVSTRQLNNANNGDYTLSDTDFENYISYNLSQQTAPVDLSNNEFDFPNSLSIIDNSFLQQSVIINNNDTILANENFAMKMNYVNKVTVPYDNYGYSIGGGSYISTNVKLLNTSESLYDSNLKIDVNFNTDSQYTEDGEWKVDFNRSDNNMNYFACINSYLQDFSGTSPFYIIENSANIYALGNNPESVSHFGGTYFGTHKYFTRDTSGIMIPNNITTSHTLDANFVKSELDNDNTDISNDYPYTDNEFNTFKIIQDTPHVENTIYDVINERDISGSTVSIQYNGTNITPATFDVSGIFDSNNDNFNYIANGFQMYVQVGVNDNQGGYTIDPLIPPVFTIDDNNLYKNTGNPYLAIEPQNTQHVVNVTNGYITPSNNSGNFDFITIGNEAETLSQQFYNVSGEIVIFTKAIDNRVYYDNNGTNSFYDSSFGTPSLLTDYVEVYYNTDEQNSGFGTNIDSNTSQSDYINYLNNVNYYVEVISASTSSVQLSDDPRNLAKNNSALLSLVSSSTNNGLTDLSFTLQSNLSTDPSYVQIVSIENQSILVEKAPIVDQSGNPIVGGSSSSVIVQSIDLSGLDYQNYRVVFTTKTINDISNLLQLQNGWSVASSNEDSYLNGTASKTGVIRDDYLFMTNYSDISGQKGGLDISMSHTFEVASPVITSTQAVKHRIAISFVDLSSNTGYDSSATVFYLDDQDITLTPVGSPQIVEDVSCANIGPSPLNTNSTTYDKNNYKFREFTSIKQFTASYDSKFHFYTNLNFVTPVISERSVYYQIYDLSDNPLPSYMLKYFQCNDDNTLLSNVYVDLVDGNNTNNTKIYTTNNFDFTQEVASIFNVDLYGTYDNVIYEDVTGSSTSFLDPFFNLKTIINGFDGRNGLGIINVQLNNGVTIDQPGYYIQTTQKPGVNVSFYAKRFIYTVGDINTNLTNDFSFYRDYFNTLDGMSNCNIDLELSGNLNVITIYDGVSSDILATVTHPTDFLDNYNIIVCSSPLVYVEPDYSNCPGSFYTLAVNNRVKVDYGVYYYLNNAYATIGNNDSFGLVSDSFSLKFCNGTFINNVNNGVDYRSETLFTQYIINNPLYSGNNDPSGNTTKSVQFSNVRGYYSYYNAELPFTSTTNTFYDVIALNRTPTTFTFELNNIAAGQYAGTNASQVFTNIYNGKQLLVDNVVGSQTYNLGLVINVNLSTLSTDQYNIPNYFSFDSGVFPINVSVAEYITIVNSNPYEPSIIMPISSGYITDIETGGTGVGLQKDLLYPYITGVKANCIKSYGNYTLTITRNVPDLRVYSLNTPSYIGNPVTADVSSSVWNYEGPIDYNQFLLTGFQVSNLNIRRVASGVNGQDLSNNGLSTNGHVVFYNSYYSYFVVAPPAFSVYGYPTTTNITTVPISGYRPSFFSTYDVINANSYTYSHLTFSQPTQFSYTSYLTNTNKYSFQIEGNKISISLYNGGIDEIENVPNGPAYVDQSTSNRYEILYENVIINQLEDLYDNNNVQYTHVNSPDSSLNYVIDYNQILFIGNSHNSTANIHFKIGDAFVGPNANPNTGIPVYYLRLVTPIGTEVSFYQSNIIYSDISDASGNSIYYDSSNGTGYYMIVDKYNTDTNFNYNTLLDGTIREVYFPVQSHSFKEIYLGSIVDACGNVVDQNTYLSQVDIADISNTSWTVDASFSLQYIGVTLSGLSTKGINDIGNLLKYFPGDSLESKALYVRRQDAIRLTNVLGNNLFRVTNSGNVQTHRVVTSNVSLYYPPNVLPNSIIAGSSDVITLFAQNTIINS